MSLPILQMRNRGSETLKALPAEAEVRESPRAQDHDTWQDSESEPMGRGWAAYGRG